MGISEKREREEGSAVPSLTKCLLPVLITLIFQGPNALAQTGDRFRPPAVPLVTSDPYFSIWSFADDLTGGVQDGGYVLDGGDGRQRELLAGGRVEQVELGEGVGCHEPPEG